MCPAHASPRRVSTLGSVHLQENISEAHVENRDDYGDILQEDNPVSVGALCLDSLMDNCKIIVEIAELLKPLQLHEVRIPMSRLNGRDTYSGRS
jgi:hypothetical protein